MRRRVRLNYDIRSPSWARSTHLFSRSTAAKSAGRRWRASTSTALRLAAETQVNCVPTVLGSMSLRPGLALIGGIVNDDRARMLPFVRGFDETALIEVTRNYVRVWIDDAILARNSTGTQLQNSTFAASAGWSTTGTTSGCTAEHRRRHAHAHGHRARRARAGEADHRGAAAGPQCRARDSHCA